MKKEKKKRTKITHRSILGMKYNDAFFSFFIEIYEEMAIGRETRDKDKICKIDSSRKNTLKKK